MSACVRRGRVDRPTAVHADLLERRDGLDVERGYSRALAYLVKHQRLSIGAMHEDLVLDPSNALVRCHTKRMLADLLTKPLDHVRHWTLLAMMGMSLPSGEMPSY